MKLSKQLQEDHDCGDFGKALEGYSERARELEDKLTWISNWLCENSQYNDFKEIVDWGKSVDNLFK